MEAVLRLRRKERVQHEGWLLKRGSGYDPDGERDPAQNLIRAVMNREGGRGERRRYFVLVTSGAISAGARSVGSAQDPVETPTARLYYFAKQPTVMSTTDKDSSDDRSAHALKGYISLTDTSRVSVHQDNVIKIVVPGRTYYIRPEGGLTPLEQQTTAATWQSALDAAIRALWKHQTRMSVRSGVNRESRLRKMSTMMSFTSGMNEVDEVPDTLEEVLASQKYHKLFKDFCKFSLAVENLLFFEAVEEFERMAVKPHANQRVLHREVKEIMDTYVVEGSDLWVNLSGNQRQELIDKVAALPTDQPVPIALFADAKMEIFNLMEKNFFRRFYREEQRKTGCFFSLYKTLGLDGYKAVLSHFGPIQSDLERVTKTYESTMVKQVEEQIKVLEDSIQQAHGVAVPALRTTCDAILQLYSSSAMRLHILQEYKVELQDQVIDPLHKLLKGVKQSLEQVVVDNTIAVTTIEAARDNLHRAVDEFGELVHIKNQIAALHPSQTVNLGVARKNSKTNDTPLNKATAFFKSATGVTSPEEKLDERMRQLNVTPATLSETMKAQFEKAKKCELQVSEAERMYESQFDETLERLEAVELHRLEQQQEFLMHAVIAQKNMHVRMKQDAERTIKLAELIDVDADLKAYSESLFANQEVQEAGQQIAKLSVSDIVAR